MSQAYNYTTVQKASGLSRREWDFLLRTNFISVNSDSREVSTNILIACTIYHQLHTFYTRLECRKMLSQIVILDKAISRDFNDRDVIMFSAFDNFKLNFRQLDSLEQWYRHKWIIRLLSKNVQGDQLGSIRIESSKVITENPKYNALICCYTKGILELIQTAKI